MALTDKSPALVQCIPPYTELVYGIVTTTTTTATVTIPQFSVCLGAMVTGCTSTTAPYVTAVSGNTFTVTCASSDQLMYLAFGKARI